MTFGFGVPAVAAVPHITPGQAASAAVAGSASLTGTDFGTKSSRIRRTIDSPERSTVS